jgi:hypothetical protein
VRFLDIFGNHCDVAGVALALHPGVEMLPGLWEGNRFVHPAKVRRSNQLGKFFVNRSKLFGIVKTASTFVPEIRTENPAELLPMENMTIAEVAETYQAKADTLYRKAGRTWTDRKWSIHSVVTEEEARFLLGDLDLPAPAPERKKSPKPDVAPARKPEHAQNPAGGNARVPRKWAASDLVLAGLLASAVLASVRNLYHVTWNLSEQHTDAALLTAVLCLSAPGFIIAGVGRQPVLVLAVAIMAFEAFCNLAVIYGGLMGVGKSGNPTRFLGLVCDIFGSGSHWTALALGGVSAGILAAVQFTAIFQLKK